MDCCFICTTRILICIHNYFCLIPFSFRFIELSWHPKALFSVPSLIWYGLLLHMHHADSYMHPQLFLPHPFFFSLHRAFLLPQSTFFRSISDMVWIAAAYAPRGFLYASTTIFASSLFLFASSSFTVTPKHFFPFHL